VPLRRIDLMQGQHERFTRCTDKILPDRRPLPWMYDHNTALPILLSLRGQPGD
jgi:hypothetical protein